jgi:hypothetical protein
MATGVSISKLDGSSKESAIPVAWAAHARFGPRFRSPEPRGGRERETSSFLVVNNYLYYFRFDQGQR